MTRFTHMDAAIAILQKSLNDTTPHDTDAQLRECIAAVQRTRRQLITMEDRADKEARKNASMGGAARAQSLSPRRKKAIARKAAKARWSK